jgi:acetate kinase
MTEAVLAVNAGSSTLKYGLYPRQGEALWKIGRASCRERVS